MRTLALNLTLIPGPNQMEAGPDLLVTMNECIVKNKGIGCYDGCKRCGTHIDG